MDSRPSLVLITVDCLRADHTGFHGYRQPTTPFLDSLSAQSLVFENAIVGGAPTYYSFPAIMASRHPLAFGRDIVGLASGESTVATILKESGYKTAAFLGGNPYLSAKFGYDDGFDVFRDSLDAEIEPDSSRNHEDGFRSQLNRGLEKACHNLGPLGAIYDELYFRYCQRIAAPAASIDSLRRFPAADVLVDQAGSWLDSVEGTPFFLWLHFMDPHAPYYPTQKALALMGCGNMGAARARYLNAYWNRSDLNPRSLAKIRAEVVSLYDAGIRWVDLQMSRFVETLRRNRLWEQCVLVITADHGEEFLEHGGRYHPPSAVIEELIHVPLLVRAPGATRGAVKSTFSLLDLAPTLLDSLGAAVPESFRGESRWKALQATRDWEGAAIVECVGTCTNPFRAENRMGARILAVRNTRFKLVVDFSSGQEQLFDLVADPHELSPLAPDAERVVRRRLLECAHQHLEQSVRSRDLNQRLRTRLRDLGQDWSQSTAGIPA